MEVESDNGQIYRRNRKHIIKSVLKPQVKFECKLNSDLDIDKITKEKSLEINLQPVTKSRFDRNIVNLEGS